MQKIQSMIFVLVTSLLLSNSVQAQFKIPEFEHNLVLPDSTFLPPIIPHNAQYEFSITLMHVSSTIYKKPFVVLAYNGNKWSTYRWTEQRDTANAGKRSYKIEEIEVSQSQSKNVFDGLQSNSLFELNRKDLNLTSRVTDNGVEHIYIYDGESYSFIIQARDKIRVIASSDPDEYAKWNPEHKELKLFIECRDLMYSLIKE